MNLTFKALIFILLIVLFCCREYPLYKNCDPQWAKDILGTTTLTLCQGGS